MTYAGTSKRAFSTYTTIEQELVLVHDGKYTYGNAVFINARTPFLVTCPIHGDFLQQPRAHKQGQGCRKCFFECYSMARKKPLADVLVELEKAIGDRFIINPEFAYENAYSEVEVTCKCCNSVFSKPIAACLFHKSNCLECKKRKSTWGPSRYEGVPTLLYYIQVNGLYKIGITTHSVATRYKEELRSGIDIKVIFTVEYTNGAEAFKEEQRILRDYAEYRYYGAKVLLRGGDSELFTIDIFNKKGKDNE